MIEIKSNTWPLPNMFEVEANDFWHWVSIWGAPASKYVQSRGDDELSNSWFKPVVFVVDQGELLGGGFVVLCYYSGPKRGQQEYFRWRECAHEFKHESGGNCYHIYTCPKCGARYDVDSSD
jgi:hypothetical protein